MRRYDRLLQEVEYSVAYIYDSTSRSSNGRDG